MIMSDPAFAPTRRLVLIDFGWSDADLLPELIRAPGVSIGLVAGARVDDPGMRAAALCGLPRTLDLADLTREIFDLALVGEHSPRRQPLERLLRLLGTEIESPHRFVHPRRAPEGGAPDAAPGESAPSVADAGTPRGDNAGLHPVEGSRRTLLTPDAFSARLGSAVGRHREMGLCFELYRLTFDGPERVLDELLRALPARLRETDAACCPGPLQLLLLCPGTPQTFASVLRRIESLWHDVWSAHVGSGPPPAIADERVELVPATD